jgi:hypothetical protein
MTFYFYIQYYISLKIVTEVIMSGENKQAKITLLGDSNNLLH